MNKAIAIDIPRVNVNDETVKLISWRVNHGEEVREGQTVAEIETSKAVVELAAPTGGTIHLRAKVGEELPVGMTVAYVGAEPPAEVSQAARAPSPLPGGTRFSKGALELLEEQGVPAEAFAGMLMVRRQDVEEYLKRQPAGGAADGDAVAHFALKDLSLEGVTLPRILADQYRGVLEPAFYQSLCRNPDAVAALAPEEKCRVYREHGADIGRDVVIGRGTVLVAPRIQLADGVRLGERSSLILRERLAMDTLCSFREGLVIRGGTVVFGRSTFAGSRIEIGGGGHADPWAVLVVGDNTYLGDELFINICRPVVIGREAFLTKRAILVTHNIGHSILDGYENTFAPIVLEDYAQVGMSATIYAGARVGERSVVGSNSYLISAIPKGKLAIGVPAHAVRDVARPLTRAQRLQIVQTMLRQFHELLELKQVTTTPITVEPCLQFVASRDGKAYWLGFVESMVAPVPMPSDADEKVVWTFDSEAGAPPEGVTIMNLLAKTSQGPGGMFVDSAREFLRKRGIRLEPGPWRYGKGLI